MESLNLIVFSSGRGLTAASQKSRGTLKKKVHAMELQKDMINNRKSGGITANSLEAVLTVSASAVFLCVINYIFHPNDARAQHSTFVFVVAT